MGFRVGAESSLCVVRNSGIRENDRFGCQRRFPLGYFAKGFSSVGELAKQWYRESSTWYVSNFLVGEVMVMYLNQPALYKITY